MTEKGIQPQVIYLDQKCWIELAKMFFGKPSEQERILLTKIQNAVNEKRAIFPLTLSNMDETHKICDDERRTQLASLMIKISRGYSFQPFIERNLRAEIFNIILRKMSAPTINIRDTILKQGISNMVGGKATLTTKAGAKPLPDDIMAELLEKTESVETLEFLLKERSTKGLTLAQPEDIDAMERIRRELWKVKDNNLRFRVFLAKNICEMVVPELVKVTMQYKLPPELIIRKNLTRKDVNALVDEVPTALCLFTLLYHRDQQRFRPIQANDFNDIWFLTLAIPYSDIVVTERMWASISTRSKLDKKCYTKIFSCIHNLTQFL
jgi:hypothetical protein